MPDDQDKLRREREFFDASSAAQFETEAPPPNEHVEMLFDKLGPIAGAHVLDCGCGSGDLALELATRGARVTGFDLSQESVRLMHARAERTGLSAPGLVSVMERLPYPDATFDAVVGKSILHHVDVAAALAEVRRVLKPGARMVFIENQVTNPILRFARNALTGRFGVARLGTPDEHPLLARDYAAIRRLFPDLTLHYPDFRFFGLFSRNVLRYRRALWLARLLGRLDAFVYKAFPPLRRYGYHVILRAHRRGQG
jgi:SAM-dependent methyltransferase